jgi:hypothetical protein
MTALVIVLVKGAVILGQLVGMWMRGESDRLTEVYWEACVRPGEPEGEER